MLTNDIIVVTSSSLAKNGGIRVITNSLFGNIFPIVDINIEKNLQQLLLNFRTVVFSGFDRTFVELTRFLKINGKKLVVFWHFSSASEVDTDIGSAWNALVPFLVKKDIDLFITCKKGLDYIISVLFGIPSFFIMNNVNENSYLDVPKSGLGIYSGSSDYWVKNLRSNIYACLMSGLPIDIVPYSDDLQTFISNIGYSSLITGSSQQIEHDDFVKRLSSRELVSYVTFSEGAPLLPLEALNNGVLCITANNHHYFYPDKRLHSFLVVSSPDDPYKIYQSIDLALKHKSEILDRYRYWKKSYDEDQHTNFEQLINILVSL